VCVCDLFLFEPTYTGEGGTGGGVGDYGRGRGRGTGGRGREYRKEQRPSNRSPTSCMYVCVCVCVSLSSVGELVVVVRLCDLFLFEPTYTGEGKCLWEVFVCGFGVLFLPCAFVSVPGVLFSVRVCVCDQLIFVPEKRVPEKGLIYYWRVEYPLPRRDTDHPPPIYTGEGDTGGGGREYRRGGSYTTGWWNILSRVVIQIIHHSPITERGVSEGQRIPERGGREYRRGGCPLPRRDTYTETDLRGRTRRGLASDGVRYADARSSVGRRVRSVTKLRLEWYGKVFLLLQQRSKHPREMVITPKASTSLHHPPIPERGGYRREGQRIREGLRPAPASSP